MSIRLFTAATLRWCLRHIPVLVFTLLVLQNVNLLYQIHDTQTQLQQARAREMPHPELQFAGMRGRRLKPLVGRSRDGQPRTIALQTKTLILSYSPHCGVSLANRERWIMLAQLAKELGWHVLWVARDDLEVFGRGRYELPAEAEVLADPSARTFRQLNQSVVPATVAVSAGGIVQAVWGGRLTDTRWAELTRFVRSNVQ